MVRVYIDEVECAYDDSLSDISLSFDSDDMADVESGRTGRSVTFYLDYSPANIAVFGLAGDVHSSEKFNSQWHSLRLEVDGVTLLKGTAYLMKVVWRGTKRYFEVECRGGVLSWAAIAAVTPFKSIDIEYSGQLNTSEMESSWSDELSAVKFFPVVRDSYQPEGSAVDVSGVKQLRSIDDYYPFFRVSDLVETIFDMGGYSVEIGDELSELFAQLYLSGGYASADNSAARAAMGFYVKRAEDAETSVDYSGRVSMSPYDLGCSVGNIVDLSTTLSDAECYNYGCVLHLDGEALEFVPLTKVSVGFEYYLHYTCVCSIESRTRLKGIDTLSTVSSGDIEWEITNNFIDQRDSLESGVLYKLVVFDFEEGEIYRLVQTSSTGVVREVAIVRSRISSVTFSEVPYEVELQKLWGLGYMSYSGDWAIYFGYIEESAPAEVKITVRSSPDTFTPTSPMRFELQMLKGGIAGTDFTLHSDTSIRPYFSAYPGYNSTVDFGDLAQIPYSALDFLGALQHLFNLRFMSEPERGVVTIESFDDLYNGEHIWDWSAKLLLSEGVEFVDFAQRAHRTTTYGYQQTDGVVKRLGHSDNRYFGEWRFTVDSYLAASSSTTLLNPIFSASTTDERGVLAVGDRDDLSRVDSLSFSPRIVAYMGISELLEGENNSLPKVVFHSEDDEFTLCFEDRDSLTGLNSRYLRYVELLGRAQELTLTLSISAIDYSNLFSAVEGAPSLRDIFYFEIYGESFRTLLKSIESYNPVSGVARCTFLTID